MTMSGGQVRARPAGHLRAPRKHLRLHGEIARHLGVGIISGRHRPGDRLDNQVKASERLAVSRAAYREAIVMLNAKGLVQSWPRAGTYVSPREKWRLFDPDVLSWVLESKPQDKLLCDLIEWRGVLAPRAAAVAASRRTFKQLDTMQRALEVLVKHSSDSEEARLANREFHTTILTATGNAFLIALRSSITAAIDARSGLEPPENSRRRDVLSDHARVLAAIEAANPREAHMAMGSLLEGDHGTQSRRGMNRGRVGSRAGKFV